MNKMMITAAVLVLTAGTALANDPYGNGNPYSTGSGGFNFGIKVGTFGNVGGQGYHGSNFDASKDSVTEGAFNWEGVGCLNCEDQNVDATWKVRENAMIEGEDGGNNSRDDYGTTVGQNLGTFAAINNGMMQVGTELGLASQGNVYGMAEGDEVRVDTLQEQNGSLFTEGSFHGSPCAIGDICAPNGNGDFDFSQTARGSLEYDATVNSMARGGNAVSLSNSTFFGGSMNLSPVSGDWNSNGSD
jgi:hypothetical protein